MKETYRMDGNFCPVCAQKIEEKLRASKEVRECNLDYVNKTLFIDSDMDIDTISKVVKSVEPGVDLVGEGATDNKVNDGKLVFNFEVISLALGILLIIAGFILDNFYIYSAAALIAGFVIYRDAFKVLINGNGFDEKVLMSISSIGAILIGEPMEGAAVMVLYRIGEWLTDLAVDRATKSLKKAAGYNTVLARLVNNDGNSMMVDASEVQVGQIIDVESFEMIPLDSYVLDDFVSIDTSSFTGETEPRIYKKGEVVPAGSILIKKSARFEVEKDSENSQLKRLDNLIKIAGKNKSKQEKFLSSFARIYTPSVVAVALIISLYPLIFGGDIAAAVRKSLAFLVTACPCSVVLGVPLAYAVGLGRLSNIGILIKGSEFVDVASHASAIAFDKTGTITDKNLSLKKVVSLTGIEEKDLIKLMSIGEKRSSHPIATAFRKDVPDPDEFEEIPGLGIDFKYMNQRYSIRGTGRSLEISLSRNDEEIAVFVLAEGIKNHAKSTMNKFKTMGIKTFLVSGDFEDKVSSIAQEVNIDEYMFEMSPKDKLDFVLEEKKTEKIIFVGDGINDGAVIKAADLGISMGKMGSDSAVESSDVVIVDDDISKIYDFIVASKKIISRARFIVVFSLLIKLIVMISIYLGYGKMFMAVLADVGLTLVCVFLAISLNLKKEI